MVSANDLSARPFLWSYAMALDYPTALSLFKAGQFAELLVKAPASAVDVAKLPELKLRLLIAEAFLFAGDAEAARMVAASENHETASDSTRARCELVLGLVARRDGDFPSAMRRLHAAVRHAHKAQETYLLAWCEIHRFRLLAEVFMDAHLAATLAEVRRSVTSAGDPHLTALLHDSVAMMEGLMGRRDEARRHLGIAASILARHPQAWIEYWVHTDAFCVAWLDSEFWEAAAHLKEARTSFLAVGGTRPNATLEVNQAHLDMIVGNFPAAVMNFERAINGSGSAAQLASMDGLAHLYFALNRFSECEALVRATVQARSDDAASGYYPLRKSSACAIKLLIKDGKWSKAVSDAEEEIRLAINWRDIPLVISLLLLQAEALAGIGDLGLSGQKLFQASELGATGVSEQRGEFYDACNRVLRVAGSPIANTFAERATRVWHRQGNLWAQLVAAESNDGPVSIRKVTQKEIDRLTRSQVTSTRRNHTGAAEILNAVAAAFDLAYDPLLASEELRRVVGAIECAGHVNIETYSSSEPRPSEKDSENTARLVSGRRESIKVTCSPSDRPLENILLANILTLVRNLDAVARGRCEDRKRAALWPATDMEDTDGLFVCEETRALLATSRKIAPTTVPVLITGETGTGKEVLARAIHAASTRAGAVFLPFNCAAGPRDMIDAQLFGHRRGSFTGATEHAPGVFRAAAGGTLFLDEIGEAPIDVQPKLLRVLESGEIHPIGEPQPLRVDVRVIAATNADLDAMVAARRLREDLFYRLNIVRLHLPPLRERRVEIPVFAHHYLSRYARDLGKGDLRLAEESMEYLLLYKWPGNVRQLANEMRRLAALAETDAVLMPEHLSPEIVAARRTIPASERTLDANEVVVRLDQPLAAAAEHLERALLQYALKASGGRMEDTARRLGLSRKGLYLKRQRFGLEPPGAHARTA